MKNLKLINVNQKVCLSKTEQLKVKGGSCREGCFCCNCHNVSFGSMKRSNRRSEAEHLSTN